MDWWLIALLVLGGAFFAWRSSNNSEKAEAARETLDRDNRLYQNIKAGMRKVKLA